MRYRHAVVIYNPAAGRRQSRRLREIQGALALLREQIATVEAWPSGGPGSPTDLARRASAEGADLVLACGGDGTVNEIVNGLAGTDIPLGLLPAGTANVLAFELGLPMNMAEACSALPQLEPHRVRLARVSFADGNGRRYFLLMGGAGLDARVVYSLNLRLKFHLGRLSYWLASFAQLGRRQETFQVEVQGSHFQCTFALIAKSSRYGGNLRIARGAHLLAEDLEVVLFHAKSSFRYLRYLGGVATGRLQRCPDVSFLKARRIAMSAEHGSRVHVHVDGEYAGRLPATMEVAPETVTLLMPPGYVQAHG